MRVSGFALYFLQVRFIIEMIRTVFSDIECVFDIIIKRRC